MTDVNLQKKKSVLCANSYTVNKYQQTGIDNMQMSLCFFTCLCDAMATPKQASLQFLFKPYNHEPEKHRRSCCVID
jgi:hypothetical protein